MADQLGERIGQAANNVHDGFKQGGEKAYEGFQLAEEGIQKGFANLQTVVSSSASICFILHFKKVFICCSEFAPLGVNWKTREIFPDML